MINIIFDQYQRYKKVQEIIDEIRIDAESFKILEVGANQHRNLEKFLPNDQITYLDIYLPEELQKDAQYVIGDATKMEFQDDTYDLIVALDVFEHIPDEQRESFILELNRVSKIGFIMLGPFDTPGVHESEVKVNECFKKLMGYEHPWLIEHLENGLPSLEKYESFLEQKNIKYIVEQHANVDIWEKMMTCHLINDYIGYEWETVQEINKFYNQYVYEVDYSQNMYRTIIVGTKHSKIIETVKNLFDSDTQRSNQLQRLTILEELNQKINDIYSNESMLKIKNAKIEEVKHQLILKDNHIRNLENIIDEKDIYIKQIEPLIELKENHIKNIERLLRDKEEQIFSKIKQIQSKDNHIRNIETQLKLENEHIKDVEEQIQLKDNHINNIQNTVDVLNREIDNLREDNKNYQDELNRIYSTILGKVIKKIANRNR